MSHPFFEATTFPWDHPLAGDLHEALYATIPRPNDIEKRCKQCSPTVQINKSQPADEIWKDALEQLTTACVLEQLCQNLLKDPGKKSIHRTVRRVVDIETQLKNSVNSDIEDCPSPTSITKATKLNSKYSAEYMIVLSARVSDINRTRAEAIIEHLRSITEDSELTLLRVEAGSVRLIVRGRQAGYEKLKSLELNALSKRLGFNVIEVTREIPSESSNSKFRFDVALSFAGDNKRDKVRQVAQILRNELGNNKVFFDEWFEAELAGHDAVDYLQDVYGKQSQLVVTCVCARYNEKPWTKDEWRAIQAFERGLRDVNAGNVKRMRFLPLRFGDGEVAGLFSTAIVPDVRNRTPEAIAKLILERLELSKGGRPSEDPSAKGETDPELLEDAARPYEPINSREWYSDSRNRLQTLAQEILEESEVTRKFILQCNKKALSMNAEMLAKAIFDSNEPMDYLRSCHNQTKIKSKLPEESRQELHACIYRLIDFIAPACYSVDDLKAMEPHVHRKEGDYAPVPTNSKCIAVTKVAAMKGVRADLNTYSTWEAFNLTELPERRDFIAHVPPPPEHGRRVEKPVDALVEVLADAVNAAQKTAEFVAIKLKRLADFDKVYFIVLFDMLPSDSFLRAVHEAFPELVLLVAVPSHRASDVSRTKEVTLEQDISDLRAEFGPQQSGNASA